MLPPRLLSALTALSHSTRCRVSRRSSSTRTRPSSRLGSSKVSSQCCRRPRRTWHSRVASHLRRRSLRRRCTLQSSIASTLALGVPLALITVQYPAGIRKQSTIKEMPWILLRGSETRHREPGGAPKVVF